MKLRGKRPLGITLLALPFLRIGCGGTLIFPIIMLVGGANDPLDALLAGRIQSENLRLASTCLLSLVWFGGYVLYAWINRGHVRRSKSRLAGFRNSVSLSIGYGSKLGPVRA